jgi:GTPase SAR1 family protein
VTDPRERPVPLLERFERFLDAVIPPPDDVTALVRRGETLLAAGDPTGALQLAQSAMVAAPSFLRAMVLAADAHAARGAPAAALATLDEAARERALPPAVLARMVECAAALGDERRALELETHTRARVRAGDGEVARRLLAAGRTLIAGGAHAAGLRLARAATVVDPALADAWLVLAVEALRRGDAVQARRAHERAGATLNPADPLANRTAGEIALALGDLASAARQLRRAWIVGDEAAVAPLVVVLSRAGDAAGLERVVEAARGTLALTARALVELGQGEHGAREALGAVRGEEVPEGLWPLALETTLRAAPDIAERWAAEAPARAGAAGITALATARERLAAGDPLGARAALEPALADARTGPRAEDLFRTACRAAWRAQLGVMLEELAAMVRETPALASLESELRTRRRELDDPLRVAILGEFSAGKSTFLNALVGATVSPMGVLPTTAHVHWLRYGEPGARVVDSRGGAVLATIDEAPRVVEKKRHAGELIEYVEVTLPVSRLARVELIDTPGFNAGDAAHEAAVRRAFDIADVALWLFDARQAGKLSETGPLTEARDARLPVLGVLNKIDQVRESERAQLLEVVRAGFAELAPLALALSAREALAATLALGNEASSEEARAAAREKLGASGMSSLLAYLDEHLVAQRAAWKQLRIARRARDLVAAAETLLVRETEARAARAERLAVMSSALVSLREQLALTSGAVRKEVGAVLREQLRGLEGRRRGERAEDAQTLAADAAAEIGYRARSRALEQLGVRLREIEQLAIELGVVAEEAAALVTAPVGVLLDYAAAEGVRDATAATTGPSFVPNDALAALEQAIARRDEGGGDRYDRLRIALEVAREELEAYSAPSLPVLR